MPRIIVMMPCRADLNPALKQIAKAGLYRLVVANPGLELSLCYYENTGGPEEARPEGTRYGGNAWARNQCLEYINPTDDYVLWVDADLVCYPPDILTTLITRYAGAVSAPMVFLDQFHGPRFYDIGGFIEAGQRARMEPPYFAQEGRDIELDSVGCMYLIPADVYRQGARYEPIPEDSPYTEHWSVMQAAKEQGYKIIAARDLVAWHAYLPDFGEDLH